LPYGSSNTPYPDADIALKTNVQPMTQFPDLKVGTHINEDTSLGNTGNLDKPNPPVNTDMTSFAPYRINENNMAKLSAIFSSNVSIHNKHSLYQASADVYGSEEGDMLSANAFEDMYVVDNSVTSSDVGSHGKFDLASYRILTGSAGVAGTPKMLQAEPRAGASPSKKKKKNGAKLAARIRTIVAQNERLAQSEHTFNPFSLFDDHSSPRMEVPQGKKGAFSISPLAHKHDITISGPNSARIDELIGGLYGIEGEEFLHHEEAMAVTNYIEGLVTMDDAADSVTRSSLTNQTGIAPGLVSTASPSRGNTARTPRADSRSSSRGRSRGAMAESLHYQDTSREKDRIKALESLGSKSFGPIDSLFDTIDPLDLRDSLSGSLQASQEVKPPDNRQQMSSRGLHTASRRTAPLGVHFEERASADAEADDIDEDIHDQYGYANDDEDNTGAVELHEDELLERESRRASNIKRLLDSQQSPQHKNMRINAEQLIDLRFIKRLFSTKISLADSQSFINRLSDLLSLLDQQGTGFVSWHNFTRTIIALAPPGLLRSDVEAFMSAQTDDGEDLVDYEEFIISGKVLVLRKFGDEKKSTKSLPVGAWLERQKLFAGEESTHTWRKHVEWYRARRSEAVVWLMRRATRAMTQCRVIENCKKELRLIGARAKAFMFLKDTGLCASKGDAKRALAKRNLLLRCLHAKRFVDIRNEAKRYLYYTAQSFLALYRDKKEEEVVIVEPKKLQADYANLYRLHYLHKSSQDWLQRRAQRSIYHWELTVTTMQELLDYGKRALRTTEIQTDACLWLRERAETARNYCTFQDNVALWLLRLGKRAYTFLENQRVAAQWLRKKGQKSLVFSNKKMEVTESLYKKGRFQLVRMQRRTTASAYLIQRKQRAVTLLQRQAEAIEYLRRMPVSAASVEGSISMSNSWLVHRGKQALAHTMNQLKAFRRLQFVAGRATTVRKRTHLAFLHLQQIGRVAALESFEKVWIPQPGNADRLKDEKTRIGKADARFAEQRKGLDIEDQWEAEFIDLYRWIVRYAPCPMEDEEAGTQISLTGFMKLTCKGKLFAVSKEFIAEEFRHINKDGFGCVYEEDVHVWFIAQCRKRHRRLLQQSSKSIFQVSKGNGKGFTFTVNDIVTSHERALMMLMKRFWGRAEKNYIKDKDENEMYENTDNNSIARARSLRSRRGFDVDDDDDDEDNEKDGESNENENEA
jgi:hypothetical protein